ncbi:hypothetical protein QM201_15160 [Enterobacter asburiae]|nr:hypothetical protein [Enterobacter asburiae]
MIYTTGSIAVSGNTLTGTGTNFTQAGSLIRNGCTVLVMTSPVQVFQITAIGNATTLTVSPAANPAIPAGSKFAILLSDSLSVDGLAQDIAETFSMYQRYMGGFADVMNGSGDVTITINGQPVTVPGQKSLAKKGANTDITSLGGLTTALSIEQGGTGARTPAAARAKLELKGAAVMDAVGSVGNGSAILEQGSVASGNYIKFADGTLICWLNRGSIDVTSTARTEGSSSFYWMAYSWVFPASFADASNIALSVTTAAWAANGGTGASAVMTGSSVSALTTTSVAARIYASISFASLFPLTLIATGRWK